MDCFDKLIDSNFLKHIGVEIQSAQSTVMRLVDECPPLGSLPLQQKDKKRKYNIYLKLFGFNQEFHNFDPLDFNTLHFMKEGSVLLLSSRIKMVLDAAISQSLLATGDIPFYRTKHKLHGVMFHAAMYDTTFKIMPITNN